MKQSEDKMKAQIPEVKNWTLDCPSQELAAIANLMVCLTKRLLAAGFENSAHDAWLVPKERVAEFERIVEQWHSEALNKHDQSDLRA